MKQLKEIIKEINTLTLKIEQEYPELYHYLDENPLTIPNGELEAFDNKVFSDYLDSLKQLLQQYTINHPQNKIQ